MAGVIEGVDQRTTLVGRNRLELLLFQLGRKQRFGINVFKVREVIRCPSLTRIPHSSPMVRGVANMRGMTITVIDLGLAIGGPPLPDSKDCFVIITEFNRQVQGFLVSGVDRIVNMNWEDILPPPRATGRYSYMTAVTNVEGELVEIVDVEKVLEEVTGVRVQVSERISERAASAGDVSARVLVVDDSSVARKQIVRTLEQLGVAYEVARDGREALDLLRRFQAEVNEPLAVQFAMVISDIEMPEMDGYTLTKAIKSDPGMQGLCVLLHTSLSGVFNENMVRKVGADLFVPKFDAEELGEAVLRQIEQWRGRVRPAA